MRLPDLVKNWIKEHQHKANDKQSKNTKTKTRRAHLRNLQRAVKSYLDRLEILRTENKRLREALQAVWHQGVCTGDLKEKVRAALEDQ